MDLLEMERAMGGYELLDVGVSSDPLEKLQVLVAAESSTQLLTAPILVSLKSDTAAGGGASRSPSLQDLCGEDGHPC